MFWIRHSCKVLFGLAILAWTLAACGGEKPLPSPGGDRPPSTAPSAALPAETPTPFPPSPTPVPLAARVDGEAITLAAFQAELARFEAAQAGEAQDAGVDAETIVLNDLIDQVLLAQGARAAGFSLEGQALQDRIGELAVKAGGEAAMAAWLSENGYTPESFETELARSVAAAWMRDQITAAIPETAEQLHARQILLSSAGEAEDVLARLDAGEDFGALASEFDPSTQGDLGWFPRGYLTVPELEEAAFGLEPEAYSVVVETGLGFHLIQVIELAEGRPLDPDARLVLQMRALGDWLEARRAESDIQVLLPE